VATGNVQHSPFVVAHAADAVVAVGDAAAVAARDTADDSSFELLDQRRGGRGGARVERSLKCGHGGIQLALHRAPALGPAGTPATCSARQKPSAARRGSGAARIAPHTATPYAPARITSGTRGIVIPPMANTGTSPAAATMRRRTSSPCPAWPGFEAVG